MKIFLNQKQISRIKKIKLGELGRKLDVNFKLMGNTLDVEGSALSEYTAANIIKALATGFSMQQALLLRDVDYMLQKINIKDYIRPSRIKQIKARLIGKKGKVLKTLSMLSDCALKLEDNTINILGTTKNVDTATSAILSLIRGSKYSSVYRILEQKPQFFEDLGLKPIMPPKKKQKRKN